MKVKPEIRLAEILTMNGDDCKDVDIYFHHHSGRDGWVFAMLPGESYVRQTLEPEFVTKESLIHGYKVGEWSYCKDNLTAKFGKENEN